MASTSTQVCNLGLRQIPTTAIISLTDGSLNAYHCAAVYPQKLALLMEITGWLAATTRVALAAESVNDRSGEWGYKYAIPSDMALAVKLIAPLVGTGEADVLCGPLVAVTDPNTLAPWAFEESGGFLYTNLLDATLEYISDNPTISAMPAVFVEALAYMVAVEVVMPITKNLQRKRDLTSEAEAKIQKAVAANANRNQPEYGDDYVPDVVKARMGG